MSARTLSRGAGFINWRWGSSWRLIIAQQLDYLTMEEMQHLREQTQTLIRRLRAFQAQLIPRHQ